MKRLIFVVAGGLAVITGTAPAVAQERCAGMTRQHHLPVEGAYDFSTNSRVEQDGQFSKYFACVENNNKDNWLRLSWFIPLIGDRWVPPGDFFEQYRLSSDAAARPILGCIQYGNLGSKVVAQLLGDAKDEQRSANNSTEVECRRSLGFDSSPAGEVVELPPDGVSEDSRLFVPSDLSDPVNSMLEVNVSYGIKPGTDGYASFFAYSAEPYKGSSKANPDLIRLRPRFAPDAKNLYSAFSSQVTPDYIQLAKEGSFGFSVVGAKQWTIEPVFYDFVDEEGNILTSLHVPLFAPADAH